MIATLKDASITPLLFGLMVGIYLCARFRLAYLSYRGDTRPEARERALKFFTEGELVAGFEYHRAGWPVSIAAMLIGQIVLLGFILTGLSGFLAIGALEWAGGRVWLQPTLYVAVLLVVSKIASLPLSYYFGYVLEHRFGFSNLTVRAWLLLQLKQTLLSWPLTLAMVTAAYAFLRTFPESWVWIIPVAALATQFLMSVLFPRLILPLFFKVKPVEDAELLEAVRDVCERGGVEVESVYMIDASRYSSHTNAFFTGFGRFKKVYLFDTLLKKHTPEEIGSILAHELGHWVRNHVFKSIAASGVAFALGCLIAREAFPFFARPGFMHAGSIEDVASLPLIVLLSSIVGFFTRPFWSSMSRRFEREADDFCLKLTGSAEVFVSDFLKLARENKSFLLPHPLVVFWNFSHPPVLERIEDVRRAAQRPEARSGSASA